MTQQTHYWVYIQRTQTIVDRCPHSLAPLNIIVCVDRQMKRMCCVEIMGCHAAFDKPLVTVWLELEGTVLMIQS